MEFWSVVIGALVGGAATFGASWWQTGRILRSEHNLAVEEREATKAQAQQAVAVVLLEAIERMRSAWGTIRLFNPAPMWAIGAARPPDPPHPALEALGELKVLTTSRALLLPAELHALCLELVTLIEEYRNLRVDGGWTAVHLNQAGADMLRYQAYVQATLNAFVKTGTTTKPIAPPVLHRQTLDPWEWP
jgi:hypothetical protein